MAQKTTAAKPTSKQTSSFFSEMLENEIGASPSSVNFLKDKKEQITLEKTEDILRRCDISVRFNEINGKIDISYKGTVNFDGKERKLTEGDELNDLLTLLYDHETQYYKGVKIDLVKRYLSKIANDNRYNPVLSYLDSITWDGEDRIAPLLNDVLHINRYDTLSQQLIIKWLMQAVALQYNSLSNSFGAEGMLILEGAQHIGKTRFARTLGTLGNYKLFSEGAKLNGDDKDKQIYCTSGWIVEFGEVETSFRKTSAEDFKNFITRETDTIRRPYAAEPTETPRHAALIGTCNTDDFLRDVTGNRRFWVVHIGQIINVDLMDNNFVSQLWKQIQIQFVEKNLQCFRLTEEEYYQLNERNADYTETLEGELDIREFIEQYPDTQEQPWGWITIKELSDILNTTRIDRLKDNQIGKVLTKLKIAKKRNKKGNVYYLPTYSKSISGGY